MKPPNSSIVDAKTVKALLVKPGGTFDPTCFVGTAQMYVLHDGGALVVFPDGHGRHWESYDEMMKYSYSSEEESFSDALPLGRDFVRSVPTLIEELPRLIGIDAATLDGSEQSVVHVDNAIERLGVEHFLAPTVFQSVTAYVGEVIRRAIDGRWESGFERQGRGEPDVIDRVGAACELMRVYKEILEHGEEGSLAAFARHTIRKHQA